MGLADDVARHNAEMVTNADEESRHRLLHVGPPPKPAKSCRLCKRTAQLADIEAQVRAGKLVRG